MADPILAKSSFLFKNIKQRASIFANKYSSLQLESASEKARSSHRWDYGQGDSQPSGQLLRT